MKFDNTYVTIDLDTIHANYQTIARKVGVPVMAVVKADAYGHGAVQIARCLQDSCDFFGVSSILEALELREAGIQKAILILGQCPAAGFEAAIRENIRVAISRYEDALALSELAQKLHMEALVHICVDTGMSRIGFQANRESVEVCAKICRLPGIVPEGLFSHFATADSGKLTKTYAQIEKFDAFDRRLKEQGITIKLRHMDNSAGIMHFSKHYEMVRAGIIMYGMYPSNEVDPALLAVAPALSWCSKVTHVKTLETGREISYGGTYVTDRPTVVATVPIGYADGYRRSLSGRFYVLIHGQKAPILGRICMDQMMVDVTGIPNVQVGDPVTLVGKDGALAISVEEIAEKADSFNYEFICGISRRVPRFYRQNGEITHEVHYLLDKHD